MQDAGERELAGARLADDQGRRFERRRDAGLFDESGRARVPAVEKVEGEGSQPALPQIDEAFGQLRQRGAGQGVLGDGDDAAHDETALVQAEGQEIDIPPARSRRADGAPPGAGGVAVGDLGRGCQGVGEGVLGATVRADGRRTATDEAAHGVRGEAGEPFPGAVDEQQPAAAVEDEHGVGGAVQEGLPAEGAVGGGGRIAHRDSVVGAENLGGFCCRNPIGFDRFARIVGGHCRI